MQYLEKISGARLQEMLLEDNYRAFERTYNNKDKNQHIIKHLLRHREVLFFAGAHASEYSELVRPHILNELKALREQKTQIEKTGQTFDVDTACARRCFYMLDNLISNKGPLDEISFLLTIPSVMYIARSTLNTFTEYSSTELLGSAIRGKNKEAAAMLRNLPDTPVKHWSLESALMAYANKKTGTVTANPYSYFKAPDNETEQQNNLPLEAGLK